MNPAPPSTTIIIATHIGGLAFNGLICWAIWSHYSKTQHKPEQKYKTFWPRFFSRWVDTFVFAPISTILLILPIFTPQNAPVRAAVQLTFVIAWAVYVIEMHRRYGQTIGKMVCRVKLVDHGSEGKVSAKQAYIREGIPLALAGIANIYLIYLIATGQVSHYSQNAEQTMKIFKNPAYIVTASLPAIWSILEVVTMLFNEKRRALHDYIAGTVVVRTSTTTQPISSDSDA